VEDVRAGKSFDIRLATDDPAAAERLLRTMCDKLLANPIVEEYAFELDGAAPAAEAPAAGGGTRP
jgi:phosphoribosylformylglycinamidine synthase